MKGRNKALQLKKAREAKLLRRYGFAEVMPFEFISMEERRLLSV